jgi:hypothetical protein
VVCGGGVKMSYDFELALRHSAELFDYGQELRFRYPVSILVCPVIRKVARWVCGPRLAARCILVAHGYRYSVNIEEACHSRITTFQKICLPTRDGGTARIRYTHQRKCLFCSGRSTGQLNPRFAT